MRIVAMILQTAYVPRRYHLHYVRIIRQLGEAHVEVVTEGDEHLVLPSNVIHGGRAAIRALANRRAQAA